MSQNKELKVLFIGDIIGRTGRRAVEKILPELKKEFSPNLIIANGENAAGGAGITEKICHELHSIGIDVITAGNHVWNQKEFLESVDRCENMVRPANYPPGVPGNDNIIININGVKIGVFTLLCRTFMAMVDCPFRTGKNIISKLKKQTNIIIADIHGEATSEKYALGWYFDGDVSCVLGTHTHVQTADDRILTKGTGYISDVGMVGAYNSIIGVEIEPIIDRFLTSIPRKFEYEKKGPVLFNAVMVNIDIAAGYAKSISRISRLIDVDEKGIA